MPLHTLGPLNCRITGNPRTARLTMILCHGFGAPGTDLVPLGDELHSLDETLRQDVAFVFPEAPHSLEAEGMPDGRAWWPINMARLQMILQTHQLELLTRAEPPGMADARAKFQEFLRNLREEYDLEISRCILGGFSQGAMLSTDITFRLRQNPAALCIYSGTLLCQEEWTELAGQRRGLRVLQSHGTIDPILPFEAAEMLKRLLIESGLEVNFLPFRGMHTIPWQALEATADMLAKLSRQTESR
ncbi:MAG: hypothetical protein R3C12_03650 [Planctomycetaceae bacterium]|nr:hypothetical protein [Planctomycetaceae bacterium]